MSHWKETTLGDLINIKHGWAFKGEFFNETKQPKNIVVAIGNFDYSGGFRFDSTRTIENLRKQNDTLEAIAQTLFKHWFVDFEFPNADGKPYKSSGGAMEPSELGEIPAGWRVGKLGDVLSLIIDYRGKTPKKLGSDWSLSGIPALSAKNIKDGQIVREDSINFVDEDLYQKWMKDELKKGDVLLTSEAPLGEVFYLANHQKYVLSQRLYSLRTKEKFGSTYLYFWLKSAQGQFLLERRATGSTVQGIRQVELRKVEIVIPPVAILSKITFFWLSSFDKIHVNNQQIQTLTKTRDVLLPKLMSGKLRIKP
ncbi:MAG: restriction endonuclease subunit S [Coleofasciculus sp. A1-SPW-01]|uniref:restriction endonuclease subunit S n=1 Tax=Coleofasciculus sp. A1-SPW-01 TaxID=3070819 RepID=UPI0033016685